MLINRLMFIYFIQEKGFGESDDRYLQKHLADFGKGNYFQGFLCPLFFEGFALREEDRSRKMRDLLGRVPYLNGGIFQKHQIEQAHGLTIEIPNQAFSALFSFFDEYHWHLDDRPIATGTEINPDVLGYIFEKYVNKKQIGAYYTKEDITEYISKNTVIPFLLDSARARCKIAFENPNGPVVWDLLCANPDRYIYPAVKTRGGFGRRLRRFRNRASGLCSKRHGRSQGPNVRQPLQPGQAPDNDPARLVTETWREYACRRSRCLEIRRKLRQSEVRDANELITLNLNLRQFAQDVIENCEGPELLRALWRSIESVTILDPTCGSGAFLFAALNILEPLYEACLDRMEAFVKDLERSGQKHRPEKFSDFRKTLAAVDAHPNRRYFIFKSIILNNLFGVDIMEEAVEICKLRLFLKLAAQVEPDPYKENLGIEPLPDIDFNIRAGNTLVGYATYEEVERAVTREFDFDNAMAKISVKAEDLQQAFDAFRARQVEGDGSVPTEDKLELHKRLKALNDELNPCLAAGYGVNVKKKGEYETWLKSYQPFHWFLEFYRIMKDGGFDVIIGNPPYLEIREVDYILRDYSCLESRTIHGLCMERSAGILNSMGCMSMIVPLSLPTTQRMYIVQKLLEDGRSAWFGNYAWRPGKLFDTVNRALTIFVVLPEKNGRTFSTNYHKWTSEDRGGLFERLNFVEVPRERPAFWIPKLGEPIEQRILEKILSLKTINRYFTALSGHRIYCRTTGGLYWKIFTDFSPKFRLNGRKGHSSRETCFGIEKKTFLRPVIAALSSDFFWWWYTITSNLRDLNPYDVQHFPLPDSAIEDPELDHLGQAYLNDVIANSTMLVREQRQTGRTETQSFKIQKSKPIIDQIDRVLARHYGFTDEELDFIINYDIKYRMGRGSENEEE